MIQYIMWGISFIALYLSIVWISLLYLIDEKEIKPLKVFPEITVVVPVYNEESSLKTTVESLLALDYPKDKLKVMIVNDGSTDNTSIIAKSLSKNSRVELINKKNAGKAAALNTAIEHIDSELFACVDADSYVEPDALKKMLHLLKEKDTAAVISGIRVNKPKNWYEKLQKFEYIIAILSRKLMASIDTLAMTPGVLSVYKTKILKEVGMFDTDNITEDFEIALRLKYNGYRITIAEDAITWTNVPNNFSSLWRQRIRWYRGFIDNHIKYRDMFFSKEHGLMGYFQLPLNVMGVVLLLVGMVIISYSVLSRIYEVIARSFVINNYIFNTFFDIPSLKDFILGHNMKIMFPIYLSIIAGFYIFYAAHKEVDEKIRNPVAIWAYFFLLPYLTCMHWIGALYEQIMGVKKKW